MLDNFDCERFAVKNPRRIMIYGATGFTGMLIARAAVELGCDLVLAARDRDRLAAAARPFGLTARAFALDDSGETINALSDIDIVLNAAGPFAATSEPLIAACLAARTHYLDVTGELSVFVTAHRHDASARERGIMILPGVGFWIVASDCLAADVATLMPEAKYLRIGCSRSELFSRGSLRTIMSETRDQVIIRQASRLARIPVGHLEWQFDYGEGKRTSIAVSLADVFTAYFTTAIPNIEGYFEANLSARTAGALAVGFTTAIGATRLRALVDVGLAAWPERPSMNARSAAKQVIVAEAEDGWRRSRRLRLVTRDGYSFTVEAAIIVLRRVISGDFVPGFQTPGKLFGSGFALSIPGTYREDPDAQACGGCA
jgi:saccharopine dehydrogenase (NAD+, L-lysine-forming)